MARSLFCWTVVAVFVQLCYESTASSGVHTCQVASKPPKTHQTQQSGNITIIKFDGPGFPHHVDYSTVNSLSTPAVVNSYTELSHTDNTTNENISTTEEVTQADYITSPMRTTVTSRQSDSRGKSKSQPELNPSCRCQIKSADSFRISVTIVWPPSQLRLHLNSTTAGMTSVQISESWNRTFQNTSVAVSIADDVLLPFYTVIMDVTGNVTSVTCTDSTGDGRNKPRAVSANTELLFEAPLLIIGAVMAVIGSLLLIIAIAVWRRYRKERKRQTKHAKAKRESAELPGDNYEMITFDNEPHVKGCSTSDSDSSVRKFSMSRSISAASHSEQPHKDSLSPTSTNPQATHAAKCQPDTKLQTAGKTKHNTKGVIGAQKGKQDNNKKNKYADDTDNGDYSEVSQEYEDISEEPLSALTKRDNRVATPLAFLKPGEQQHALKKTDNLNQINAKTESLLHPKLLNDANAYSHLDRLEKLRSHGLWNKPRDNLVSNTADVENSAADVVHVNIHSSDNPKQVAQIKQENEGVVTSATKGEEEQDHIYEALGEQGDNKEREDNIKPASNCCLTTEPKSANDTSLPEEGADNYLPDNKPVTSAAVQPDLADNKGHDGGHIHNGDEGKPITQIETILRNPTEMHLEERGQESPLVQDNHPTQRPMTMVRQSAARFHNSLTEAPAGTDDVRTSTTERQKFDNCDTNDNTQIINVKDPKERKKMSNYINVLPVEKSMNMDRQFSVSNQATVHGIQGDARTSNKDSNDCSNTYDKTHATEAADSPTNRQLNSGYNILPTEKSVNMDRRFSLSGQANKNDIQEDARISHKDADANCVGDLKKSDVALFNSNPPETNPATALGGELDAQNYSYCIDEDLESYTIIDNIVYESLPITEL